MPHFIETHSGKNVTLETVGSDEENLIAYVKTVSKAEELPKIGNGTLEESKARWGHFLKGD